MSQLKTNQSGNNEIVVGMGCFWGVQKLFSNLDGVIDTEVGYAGGKTSHPTYVSVCSGSTGHLEAVRVVFDPEVISFPEVLAAFWENHDPTQGLRQGNDIGSEYRSAIYVEDVSQLKVVEESARQYAQRLAAAGYGSITTEIEVLSDTRTGKFWSAEPEHQHYLLKNPYGYCPIHATGVTCG